MKNIWIFLLTLLTYGMLSCHDDNNDDASLSFGRSIYILQANGALEVELRADGAVEEQTVVKFTVGGSAVRGEEPEVQYAIPRFLGRYYKSCIGTGGLV